MRTNTDITLYSKSIVAGEESYIRSVIRDVKWEDRRAANARQPGEIKADDVAIYIPMARGVLSIRVGDVIVRGIVTDEISPAFTVTALRAKYPLSVCAVKSVDRMDQGSPAIRHWQIGGA